MSFTLRVYFESGESISAREEAVVDGVKKKKMNRRFDCAQSDLECSVCLCLWSDPTELRPCGHIFCGRCAERLTLCPECRAAVLSRCPPNRIIVGMVRAATGSCSRCSWTGVRQAFELHECFPWTPRGASLASSPAAGAQATQCAEQLTRDPAILGAAEYGLPAKDVEDAMRWWPSFRRREADDGCPSSSNETDGSLDRNRVADFCRFMNIPCCSSSSSSLEVVLGLAGSEPLTLHAVLVLMSVHRRDPVKEYGMTHDSYTSLMNVLRELDVTRKGLLEEAQVRLAAERFLRRAVAADEWDAMQRNVRLWTEHSLWAPLCTFHHVVHFLAGGPSGPQPQAPRGKPPFFNSPGCGDLFVRAAASEIHFPGELMEREKLQKRVLKLVRHYDAPLLASIDEMIKNFYGQEQILLDALIEKYGPEPK